MEAKKAGRGEVVIDEGFCGGCGYCIIACKRGCLDFAEGKISPGGVSIPAVIKPEKCNACGVCAIMCPALAIEVYELVTSE